MGNVFDGESSQQAYSRSIRQIDDIIKGIQSSKDSCEEKVEDYKHQALQCIEQGKTRQAEQFTDSGMLHDDMATRLNALVLHVETLKTFIEINRNTVKTAQKMNEVNAIIASVQHLMNPAKQQLLSKAFEQNMGNVLKSIDTMTGANRSLADSESKAKVLAAAKLKPRSVNLTEARNEFLYGKSETKVKTETVAAFGSTSRPVATTTVDAPASASLQISQTEALEFKAFQEWKQQQQRSAPLKQTQPQQMQVASVSTKIVRQQQISVAATAAGPVVVDGAGVSAEDAELERRLAALGHDDTDAADSH